MREARCKKILYHKKNNVTGTAVRAASTGPQRRNDKEWGGEESRKPERVGSSYRDGH